ncbi:hypothetical protein CC80DRAFT_552890 [Byssothecium circinans]|uniref:Uncharacterized protein n=1 Tax=Byssothecium circinans TaxID=147558 RepID=A0A6A5THG9_9PLEO|nr:hypothetical protein CC80DRAFT_552890 [Byssothecium circinans]
MSDLLEYASSKPTFAETAVKIDGMFKANKPTSAYGFAAGKRSFSRSRSRERFVGERRSSAVSSPLTHALQYIGYAIIFTVRKQQQHDGGSVNWLMHLCHSICQRLWPGVFPLEASPICFLAHEDEFRMGELLLTLIADSMYSTGGGFNVADPGLNNASADMLTSGLRKGCREFRENQPFWEASLQEEQPLLDRHAANPPK